MKKIFFGLLAVAALASCTNDETIVSPKGSAIAFENAYVDNATRATDLTANNLQDFGVYASVKSSSNSEGLIMENTTVTKQGNGAYTYANTQYWVPNATYSFAAIAPKSDAKWAFATDGSVAHAGTITFDNEAAAANQDLIYSFESRSLDANALNTQPAPVAFTFNHMLSRIRFTFVNNIASVSNITTKISNVKITDTYKKGTLAVENGVTAQNWEVEDKNLTVAFANAETILAGDGGSETTEHHYLIPNSDEYVINFDVTIYQAGVELGTYARSSTVRLNMEKGKSYDVKASLTHETVLPNPLYPIEFTVTKIEDWSNYSNVESVPTTNVNTADKLVEAIAKGYNVVMTEDINLDDVTTRAAAYAGLTLNNDVVIDGGNHTLSTSAVRGILLGANAKNVTIKNLTFNATGERGIQLQDAGQTLIVEKVKAVSANRTINVTATSEGATVIVKDSEIKGLTPINVWGANHNVTIDNTKIILEDNNSSEGYSAVYNVAENTTVNINGGEVVVGGTAADDSFAGLVSGNSVIKFNGTEGNCTIVGHVCAINYGANRYTFATLAEAIEVAKDGETIIMIDNATITSHLNIKKNITLDFNGKTLTVDAQEGVGDDAIWVRDNAEVVITGNGNINFINTVESTVYASGIFATGTSKVTIESCNIEAGAEAVFAQSNATVEILGGSFKSVECPQYTLNLKDSARATASIVVKGGKYYNFNPANNAAEGEDTNFVAEGKTVEQEGDWYIVK